MRSALWGYMIIGMGIAAVVIILLLQRATTTSEEDFYLGREVLEASMIDAVDYGTYRTTGKLVMSEQKFVEVFLRRFAESVTNNKTYEISFYDIHEEPPKASVRIRTTSGDTANLGDTAFDVTLDTLMSGILETKYSVIENGGSGTSGIVCEGGGIPDDEPGDDPGDEPPDDPPGDPGINSAEYNYYSISWTRALGPFVNNTPWTLESVTGPAETASYTSAYTKLEDNGKIVDASKVISCGVEGKPKVITSLADFASYVASHDKLGQYMKEKPSETERIELSAGNYQVYSAGSKIDASSLSASCEVVGEGANKEIQVSVNYKYNLNGLPINKVLPVAQTLGDGPRYNVVFLPIKFKIYFDYEK